MFELIVSIFRVVPPAMMLETRGTPGDPHPHPVPALGPPSPHPLSLSIGPWGIWSYVLESDEAHRLHSNSIRVVTQLKILVDYLQVAL